MRLVSVLLLALATLASVRADCTSDCTASIQSCVQAAGSNQNQIQQCTANGISCTLNCQGYNVSPSQATCLLNQCLGSGACASSTSSSACETCAQQKCGISINTAPTLAPTKACTQACGQGAYYCGLNSGLQGAAQCEAAAVQCSAACNGISISNGQASCLINKCLGSNNPCGDSTKAGVCESCVTQQCGVNADPNNPPTLSQQQQTCLANCASTNNQCTSLCPTKTGTAQEMQAVATCQNNCFRTHSTCSSKCSSAVSTTLSIMAVIVCGLVTLML